MVIDVDNYSKNSCVYTSWDVPAIYGETMFSIGLELLKEGSKVWHICELP